MYVRVYECLGICREKERENEEGAGEGDAGVTMEL